MPDITLRGGEVDGLAIHYVVAGRGPAVVLLHGLGGFAQSWRHTIDALATRATVFALDLPGFGRTPRLRIDDWSVTEKNVVRIAVIGLLALNWIYLLAHREQF